MGRVTYLHHYVSSASWLPPHQAYSLHSLLASHLMVCRAVHGTYAGDIHLLLAETL
jgi:hypothetical protein